MTELGPLSGCRVDRVLRLDPRAIRVVAHGRRDHGRCPRVVDHSGAKFERVETIGEHRTGRPRCPKCDGEQVVEVPTPFVAMTGKKG